MRRLVADEIALAGMIIGTVSRLLPQKKAGATSWMAPALIV